MDWSLQTAPTDDSLRITATGELDLVTAPLLARALREAAVEADRAILLDLTGVTFMDSSGLAAVLEAVQRSRESAGTLRISPGNGAVVRVLELAGLLDGLPLVERA
ncbi:MAG: anti-sigma factor antagonist [Solirubrobacterales bacterium]|nr:anti-sigma factor antagonist [Solirubrobacterales bacterium]